MNKVVWTQNQETGNIEGRVDGELIGLAGWNNGSFVGQTVAGEWSRFEFLTDAKVWVEARS